MKPQNSKKTVKGRFFSSNDTQIMPYYNSPPETIKHFWRKEALIEFFKSPDTQTVVSLNIYEIKLNEEDAQEIVKISTAPGNALKMLTFTRLALSATTLSVLATAYKSPHSKLSHVELTRVQIYSDDLCAFIEMLPYPGNKLEKLILKEININEKILFSLASVLRRCTLRELYISGDEGGEPSFSAGMDKVMKALKYNKTLKDFQFSSNKLYTIDTYCKLIAWLYYHPRHFFNVLSIPLPKRIIRQKGDDGKCYQVSDEQTVILADLFLFYKLSGIKSYLILSDGSMSVQSLLNMRTKPSLEDMMQFLYYIYVIKFRELTEFWPDAPIELCKKIVMEYLYPDKNDEEDCKKISDLSPLTKHCLDMRFQSITNLTQLYLPPPNFLEEEGFFARLRRSANNFFGLSKEADMPLVPNGRPNNEEDLREFKLVFN